MNIDQARQLIAQLGTELGGNASTYSMDDHGEVNLAFDNDMPVNIRFHEETLILATVIANDVSLDDPGLFATLMDYQFMGIRTYGCVMSWNPSSDCLLLSRQLYAEPTAHQLAVELNILLKASNEVHEELQPLLNGEWSPQADDGLPTAQPTGALPNNFPINLA
jgi:hypothetical protein